jgi:DNA primase
MIEPTLIQDIKDSADLVEIIGETVSLKNAGANYKGNCPFHNENTPSFVVSPAKGFYKCFGCGESGDVITFLMKNQNMTYLEAIQDLSKRTGIEIPKKEYTQEEKEELRLKESIYNLNQFTADWFHDQIWKEENALFLEYALSRWTQQQIVEWKIGVAPEGFQTYINAARDKGYTDQLLKDAGLAKEAKGRLIDFLYQ